MELSTLGLGALALGAFVALALATLVLRTDPRATANRRLFAVLVLEGVFIIILAVTALNYGAQGDQPHWLSAVTLALFVAISCSYLLLLAVLDTPLVRPFRSRWMAPASVALVLALLASGLAWGTPAEDVDNVMAAANGILASGLIIGAGVLGIAASASAYRRTRPHSIPRKRATSLLIAFATRDTLWVATIIAGITLSNVGQETLGNFFWGYAPGIIVLSYVPLLAYGILKAQLFDIDLKIKVGIRRSTVVTIILVVALAAAKTAEFYLNRTYGWIAGGVAAGAMLVLAPRLNKMGEKVATTAMPKVDASSQYLEFRKMEVYKTALESALEGGLPTAKERATLERLRAKLGIREEDARALEADVAASLPRSGHAPDATSA